MKKLKILLIEDNPDLAEMILDYLDHEVIWINNMTEALPFINDNYLDLIIADFNLGDGYSTDLNILDFDTPLIIQSGVPSCLLERKIKKANQFLTKPYSLEELDSAIKRCVKINKT